MKRKKNIYEFVGGPDDVDDDDDDDDVDVDEVDGDDNVDGSPSLIFGVSVNVIQNSPIFVNLP